MGYARAGFDVVGVDHQHHADYPYPQHTADAVEFLAGVLVRGEHFDVIHASPPCPRYSDITPAHTRASHPDLLGPVRLLLEAWAAATGGTWVLENVPGAPLPDAVVLCGPSLGLPSIRRHRLFASSEFLMAPGCACPLRAPFGVYGDHPDDGVWDRVGGGSRGRKATSLAHAQAVLGIDWMTRWDDLADAVPPAYTEFVGEQVLHGLAILAGGGPT